MPVHGGAMAKLSRFLGKLDENPLPIHITPPARLMFESMASAMGGINGAVIRQLTNPSLTNGVLKMLGGRGRIFNPLVRNTVSPTILHGSNKVNVIPGEVSVELDGRLLPGFEPRDMIRELKQIVGNEVELEVIRHDPGPSAPDMRLFDMFARILREADPNGLPIPLLLSGVTDGRFFSRLGIQTYGFLPMNLPADFNFTATIHAADERIPAVAVEFGANAIYKAIQRFN